MERLIENNIAVDAFSIVVFSFSPVFTEAIEAKQTAEQLALKAKRDLDRIKIEAEQKIAAAKAEAESLRLQRANISPDLIELRRIEANMKAIEKWNGILPQVTGGGAIPLIGLGDTPKILNHEETWHRLVPNSNSVRIMIELLLNLLIFVCDVPFLVTIKFPHNQAVTPAHKFERNCKSWPVITGNAGFVFKLMSFIHSERRAAHRAAKQLSVDRCRKKRAYSSSLWKL